MSVSEFNQMIIINQDYLRPFAITLTKDKESAKDLLQETMYRALSNQEKYNAGTNIKAWLYTIMRNIFINNYRKSAKQNIISDSNTNDYLLDYKSQAINNEADMKLSMKDIHATIYQLPEIFRNPFKLYFEGYKYHEIAHLLDEPLGTIKSRIHFARKLLKQQVTRF